MDNPINPQKRIRPDVARISRILKGQTDENVRKALGMKTPNERGLEAARNYQELCEFSSSRKLTQSEASLQRNRTREFLKELYSTCQSLEVLMSAELVAVVRGSEMNAGINESARAKRALEIIKDPALRPKNFSEISAMKDWWVTNESTKIALCELRDEYVRAELAEGRDLSLDRLLILVKYVALEDTRLSVIGHMIPKLTDRFKAQRAYSVTTDPSILKVFVRFLRSDMEEADTNQKLRLTAELIRDHDLPKATRLFAIESCYYALLNEDRLIEAREWLEQSSIRELGAGSDNLNTAFNKAYDRLNFSGVLPGKTIEDLREMANNAPYKSLTKEGATNMIRQKIQGLVDSAKDFGEINTLLETYGFELDEKQEAILRNKRRPHLDELIANAKSEKNFEAIWLLLDGEERHDLAKKLILRLALICELPEEDDSILLPMVE
jgi:hypothetical protein